MLLKGSCHCGEVSFEAQSRYPYPFNRCYCSICRKTGGGGGYVINLSADAQSLKIKGSKQIKIYRATIDKVKSRAERHFCAHCGSYLWVSDSRWPELIHPFASSIDSDLPVPPEHTHLMLDSKEKWVEVQAGKGDKYFPEYPDESIAAWHQRLSLAS
jgi:hypothetical protein